MENTGAKMDEMTERGDRYILSIRIIRTSLITAAAQILSGTSLSKEPSFTIKH